LPSINFQRTYQLSEAHAIIKECATQILGKYLEDPALITFNDQDRCVTFSSERLIPSASTNKPRVMLLFSNPHPYSVQQGMFLSPSSKGRENLFWPIMYDAGWLPIPQEDRTPEKLVEICLKARYEGPFEFIFYCYYAFPTNYPEDIQRIFGKEYFEQVIEPEASVEFKNTIQQTGVNAVVTFNKGVFNLVSKDTVDNYIDRLIQGDLIHSEIDGIDISVPIFFTFPTGWRYNKEYRRLRKASLDAIRTAI
jgi:hypothetical protein